MTAILKPRIATVWLYQGDDIDRLQQLADDVNTWQERLDDAREAAKTAPPRGMLDTDDPVSEASASLRAAQEAHDAFLTEAKPRAVKVVIEALGRKKWKALVDDHPPRDDQEVDKLIGVNDEEFREVLVPLSMVEPKFDTTGECADFLDALSMGQYRQIYVTAFGLNTANGADPKALTDSVPSLIGSVTQP